MRYFAFLLLVVYIFSTGCTDEQAATTGSQSRKAEKETTNEHAGHDHEGHSHENEAVIATGGGHEHSEENISFTAWGEQAELFVKFSPLVAGEESHMLVHLTKLSDYTPIDHVHLSANLKLFGKEILLPEAETVSEGIFEIQVTPEKPGRCQIEFSVGLHDLTDVILIETEIYGNDETAMDAVIASEAEVADKINFTKEQVWNTDFATEIASLSPICETFVTSGQLIPAPGDEITISAESEGIVKFNGFKPLIGQALEKDDTILKLLASGTENNLNLRYQQAKAEYEKDRANVDRAKKLLEKNFISQKEFDEINTEFITAKTNYEMLSKNFQGNGQLVKATLKGFVRTLYVSEGDYVEVGQPIVTIAQNRRVLLKADLSQKYSGKIHELVSASFRASHTEFYYNTDLLHGKLISHGKSVSVENHLLPVYFEIDNVADILPGSFLEITLMTASKREALTIPKEALVEEFGSYSVFVQTGGETYEKRQVKLGAFDGFNYEVLSGITAGERIVTRGAFQVKIASMSNAIPAHGHEH